MFVGVLSSLASKYLQENISRRSIRPRSIIVSEAPKLSVKRPNGYIEIIGNSFVRFTQPFPGGQGKRVIECTLNPTEPKGNSLSNLSIQEFSQQGQMSRVSDFGLFEEQAEENGFTNYLEMIEDLLDGSLVTAYHKQHPFLPVLKDLGREAQFWIGVMVNPWFQKK